MRESLVPQLDVAVAQGRTDLVFVLGSKGRRLAVEAGVDERDVVETANEVGWMLEQAAERGFRTVTLRGHVGKLVKLAAGIFDTHSRVADARLVTLAAYAGAGGVPGRRDPRHPGHDHRRPGRRPAAGTRPRATCSARSRPWRRARARALPGSR